MTTVTVTNEEAAIQAKAGDNSMIEALWINNQGLIRNMVYGMTQAGESFDDMFQDAFFSLLAAIESFVPENGIKFSTFLRNAIRWKAYRKRTQAKSIGSLTLDTPTNEDSDETRADRLIDANAVDPEDAAEQSDLSRIIEESLSRLPTMNEQCVRLQYLQGQPISVIAQQTGVQEATARARATAGLRELRRNPRLREISGYYDQAYHGTGIGSYRNHCETSSVERLALKHLEAAEQEQRYRYFRGEIDDY